ncbi:MAG: GGDEF domain-containing protein [Lysobacteraceae bacterium]
MAIDILTVTVFGAMLSLALVLVMLPALQAASAGLRSSLAIWTVALALQGLYWLIFWYTREAPPLARVVLANMTISLSYAAFALAIQRFMRAPDQRVVLGVVLLAALAGNLWFGLAAPSYAGRVAVIGSSLAVLMGLAAAPLLPAFRQPGRLAERMTAGVLLLGAGLMLLRVLELPFAPAAHEGPLQARPTQLMTLLFISMLPVLTTVSFLLMHARRATLQAQRLAGTDALTNLPNRRSTHEMGVRALAEARRHRRALSLLLVDIDRFRAINQSYGTRAADGVLADIGRRIGRNLRTEDSVGRIGGEEFVVLLPETPLERARDVAERIRADVAAHHFRNEGEEVPATVSIGVAARVVGEGDFDALLQRAESAMLAAKRGGRNRIEVAPGDEDRGDTPAGDGAAVQSGDAKSS